MKKWVGVGRVGKTRWEVVFLKKMNFSLFINICNTLSVKYCNVLQVIKLIIKAQINDGSS